MIHTTPIRKYRWPIFIGLAVLALAIRVPRLAERPMHTDEAVNAYITGDVLAGRPFHYDARDRHGPVLYLLAAPVARLCGAKDFASLMEFQLRLTPALAGASLVLLCGAAVRWFGAGVSMVAAALCAFGPLPVYYSRYFIHETPFVAATLIFALTAARAVADRSGGYAVCAGIAAAVMIASKETALLHFVMLGIAAAACSLSSRRGVCSTRVLIPAGAAFIVAATLLFTWGGRNWSVISELWHAGPHWAARAAGQGHEKPFWYYVSLLGGGFSGLPFLALAVTGLASSITAAVRRHAPSSECFVSVYAILAAAMYSAIPYKTPWLALNLWLPLAFLAGIACVRIGNALRTPIQSYALSAAAAVLASLLALDVRVRVFQAAAAERNPYAYAHTGEDLLRLPIRLRQLAIQGGLKEPQIAVVAADPWPLPWYLRTFPQVGFWKPGQEPGVADFFVTSPEAAEPLRGNLQDRRPEYFGVRPEVVVILWTRGHSTLPHD